MELMPYIYSASFKAMDYSSIKMEKSGTGEPDSAE